LTLKARQLPGFFSRGEGGAVMRMSRVALTCIAHRFS
jgi:hypothetical protein